MYMMHVFLAVGWRIFDMEFLGVRQRN